MLTLPFSALPPAKRALLVLPIGGTTRPSARSYPPLSAPSFPATVLAPFAVWRCSRAGGGAVVLPRRLGCLGRSAASDGRMDALPPSARAGSRGGAGSFRGCVGACLGVRRRTGGGGLVRSEPTRQRQGRPRQQAAKAPKVLAKASPPHRRRPPAPSRDRPRPDRVAWRSIGRNPYPR